MSCDHCRGRDLCLGVILLFLLLVIYIIVAKAPEGDDVLQTNASADGCLECQGAAKRLQSLMNFTASPCDDFYEFTCGGYINNGRRVISNIVVARENATLSVLERIDDMISRFGDSFVENQLKTFYQSCMSFNKSDWLKQVEAFIEQSGGWNSSQEPENFNWIELGLNMSKLGFEADLFVNLGVTRDTQNHSRLALYIEPSSSSVHFNHYLAQSSKIMNIHFKNSELREIRRLGDSIEAAKSGRETALDPNRTSLAKLSELTGLDWIQTLNSLHSDLKPQQGVVVADLDYLIKVSQLVVQAPKRVLRNYMLAKWITQQVGYYPEGEKSDERIFTCFMQTQTDLGLSLAAAHARRHLTREDRLFGEKMVNYIRNELDKMIQESCWVSAETKIDATFTIQSIKSNVAYLDMMMSDEAMRAHFKGLELSASDFFANILNINKFMTRKLMNRIQRETINTTDESIWTFSRGIEINAVYDSLARSINILPAIMQGHYYGLDRPSYLNFGSLGPIIGRELMHSLDEDETLASWMANATLKSIDDGAACFAEQYDGQLIEQTDFRVGGRQTLLKNLADIGGIEAAFRAYIEYAKQHGRKEKKLPTIDLNKEQLFWVSLASPWCDDPASHKVALSASRDEQSNARIRVNLPLSNIKDFSRVFECPLGSRMNPKHKCQLW